MLYPSKINELGKNYLFTYRFLPFLVIATSPEFRGLRGTRQGVITEITYF